MNKNESVRPGYRAFMISFVALLLAMSLSAGSARGQEEKGEPSGDKVGKSLAFDAPGGLKVLGLMGPNPVRLLLGTPEERAWIRITVRDTPVTFFADEIAQETAKDIITATGSVTIESGTSTVESHTMVYDAKKQQGRFSGKPGVPGGVRFIQRAENGEGNYYETDWMIVTFGAGGIEGIETGRGGGEVMLTGQEPLPLGQVEPATAEGTQPGTGGLLRSIAPPPIDDH